MLHDPIEEQWGFKIGEHLTWVARDGDLAVGSRGTVTGFGENPDHVKVQFPKPQGTLRFHPTKLEKETMKERVKQIQDEPRDVLPFSPQGPGRPRFSQTWSSSSAPDLAARVRAEHDLATSTRPEQSQVHADHDDYHQGLEKLLKGLAMQTKKRKAAEVRRVQTEKAQVEMKRAHELFLKGARTETQRPAWTYSDAPNFFERPPLYEQGESKVCCQNKNLSGIYDVTHPDFKPPHAEFGGWQYAHPEITSDGLALFANKTVQGGKMSPGERRIQERLERSLDTMQQLAKQDALNKTTGSVKKQWLMESLGDHSALKRVKQPWIDQAVATQACFGSYKPYKPGDFFYETGMDVFVQEPERRHNHQKQIIVGNEQQKSFWKCPTSYTCGTNRKQVHAFELLAHHERGTGRRPPSPNLQRKVLLKGTGSLSFTHFKDALLQPLERFSPGDRSAPP